MGSQAALRFEPVGCVATVTGRGDAVQVLDLGGRHVEVACESSGDSDHFGVVYGSMICLGDLAPGVTEVPAAAVFELPDGRFKAMGTASVHRNGSDVVQVVITATSDNGYSFRLVAEQVGLDLVAKAAS